MRRNKRFMNAIRAKQMEKQLAGREVAGWTIVELINFGKSAIVLKARAGETFAAVKVFDPEIIEKHGAEIQAERIDREKSLVGKVHPHLIQILDGGYWGEQGLFFVVMEFLPWKNLAEVLRAVPVGFERRIISQIASAVRFLEKLEICHRDIKPENIAVSSDFQKTKLLDLGVIRRHGAKSVTDGTGGKVFLGTLKYSPPEFLLREEQDSLSSWRAITFYQLGGVLHDLIMRRSLFADFENPYARLVNAVQNEVPRIESKAVSPSLVELARYCLLKPAETRLKLVTWKDFEEEQPSVDNIETLKAKILRRNLAARIVQANPKVAVDGHSLEQKLDRYMNELQTACRDACIDDRAVFPPIEIRVIHSGVGLRHFLIQFEPSKSHCLQHFLRIEFMLKWVDSCSDVCEVLAGDFIVSKMPNPRASLGKCPFVVFKGVYNLDRAKHGIVEMMYKAINSNQTSVGLLKGKRTLGSQDRVDVGDTSHRKGSK